MSGSGPVTASGRVLEYTRPWMYPKQLKAMFCAERYGLTEATTKAGKTVSAICWLFEEAAKAVIPGRNYWWIAPIYPQAAIAFKRMCRGLPNTIYTSNKTDMTVTLANGSVIWFKSGDTPDALFGEDVYAAVIDEASRCFLAGTPVDTPSGKRAIETLQCGESVLNACGTGTIQRTIKKRATKIAVVMVEGSRIVCSHDHRFFTQRGWIEANRLTACDKVLSQNEGMRLLRDPIRPEAKSTQATFLRSELLREMENVSTGNTGAGAQPRSCGKNEAVASGVLEPGDSADIGHEKSAGCQKRDGRSHCKGEGFADDETERSQAYSSQGQRLTYNRTSENHVSAARFGLGGGALHCDRTRKKERWIPSSLSDGFGEPIGNDFGRNRRTITQDKKTPRIGRKKNRIASGERVESISIYESGSDEFRAISGGKDHVELYDLSVSGHPSFSVHGLLVHNCKEDAWFAVRSTLTQTRGPIRMIGNVKGRRNWFYNLCRRAESGEPDMHYAKLIAADAVAAGVLSADEVEDARRKLPDAVFRELYLAEPSDDGGNPFGIAAIARCVVPGLSHLPVQIWGIDLAKSVDWTWAIGLDVNGNVARSERWQGPWDLTKKRIEALVGRTQALIDSTGVGDPIVEDLQKRCSRIEGFKFTSNSKQQIMEGLASDIQQGATHYPDGILRQELESYEYEYTRLGVKYTAPEGLHDDGVCALALARHKQRNKVTSSFDVLMNPRK